MPLRDPLGFLSTTHRAPACLPQATLRFYRLLKAPSYFPFEFRGLLPPRHLVRMQASEQRPARLFQLLWSKSHACRALRLLAESPSPSRGTGTLKRRSNLSMASFVTLQPHVMSGRADFGQQTESRLCHTVKTYIGGSGRVHVQPIAYGSYGPEFSDRAGAAHCCTSRPGRMWGFPNAMALEIPLNPKPIGSEVSEGSR